MSFGLRKNVKYSTKIIYWLPNFIDRMMDSADESRGGNPLQITRSQLSGREPGAVPYCIHFCLYRQFLYLSIYELKLSDQTQVTLQLSWSFQFGVKVLAGTPTLRGWRASKNPFHWGGVRSRSQWPC